jgi:uncharacterized protein YndB with AHSA1/START domain
MATNISTILIKAPVHKIWEALTNPELVKKWQFGSDLITDNPCLLLWYLF